jgi:exodeoxyribonuclease VII small subunit
MERDQKPDNDRQQELTSPDTALSFEVALQRLEQTVARLESSDLPLDESLRLFQEGTRLSRICTELLESIENRITQLVEAPDGSLREIPFTSEGPAQ